MQDTSANCSYINEDNSVSLNRTISESQLSSPRSMISSTSKLINPNKLKRAQKPNLNDRSFKRILTVANLQNKSNIISKTTNVSEEKKMINQTSTKVNTEGMDYVLNRNNQISRREKLLTQQNKYLLKQNEQLKKKLQAFNNIQARIQNLQALNQILQQRLREKETYKDTQTNTTEEKET